MSELWEAISEIYGPLLALVLLGVLWIPRTIFWCIGCGLCWCAEKLDRFGTFVSDRLIV